MEPIDIRTCSLRNLRLRGDDKKGRGDDKLGPGNALFSAPVRKRLFAVAVHLFNAIISTRQSRIR